MTDEFVGPKTLPPGKDYGDIEVSPDGQAWEIPGISGTVLTASKAAVTDGSGNITTSTTTATQIGYLDSLAANVQTQINTTHQESYVNALRGMGSPILALSFMGEYSNPTPRTLTQNAGAYTAIYIPRAMAITGVMFFQRTQGNYTASQNNYIGLYTCSAGVLSLVALSANNGDLWKGVLNTFITVPFTTPYSVAAAGTYFIGCLYNRSAQTTAPQIQQGDGSVAGFQLFGLPNSGKMMCDTGTNNTLPTSVTLSVASNSTSAFWFAAY